MGLFSQVLIVGNKISDRIVREKLSKFTAQLSRQSFVVRQDERRPIYIGDGVRHREGFARTRNAQ